MVSLHVHKKIILSLALPLLIAIHGCGGGGASTTPSSSANTQLVQVNLSSDVEANRSSSANLSVNASVSCDTFSPGTVDLIAGISLAFQDNCSFTFNSITYNGSLFYFNNQGSNVVNSSNQGSSAPVNINFTGGYTLQISTANLFSPAPNTTPRISIVLKSISPTSAVAATNNTFVSWLGTRELGVSGGVADTYAVGIAIDGSGNIYVAGKSTGNLDGQTLTGVSDIAVVKYNSSGTKQWTRLIGYAGKSYVAASIDVDSDGNSYIIAQINGPLGGQSLTGTQDVALIKYNTSGQLQWVREFGIAAQNSYVNAVRTDASGNIYLSGCVYGTLNGQALTGNQDIFLVKYNPSGSVVWTTLYGQVGTSLCGNGIDYDNSGNIYMTIATSAAIGGQALTGTVDSAVIKFNSSGVAQWTRLLGVAGQSTNGIKLKVDRNSGYIYATGTTTGALDGQAIAHSPDVFIVKYDSTGAKQWTRLIGGNGVGSVNALTVGSDGGVTALGNVSIGGIVATMNGVTIPQNSTTGFLVQYDSTGVKQWTQLLGYVNKYTGLFGGTTDSSGNIFVTGLATTGIGSQTLMGNQDLYIVKYNSSGTLQ